MLFSTSFRLNDIYIEDFIDRVIPSDLVLMNDKKSIQGYNPTKQPNTWETFFSKADFVLFLQEFDIIFSMKLAAFKPDEVDVGVMSAADLSEAEKYRFELLFILYDCVEVELYSYKKETIERVITEASAFFENEAFASCERATNRSLTIN